MQSVIVDLAALLLLARVERTDDEAEVLKEFYRADVVKVLQRVERVAILTERSARLIEPTVRMIEADGVRVTHAEFGATLDGAGTALALRAALTGLASTDTTVITDRRIVASRAMAMDLPVLPVAWLHQDGGFRLVEREVASDATPLAVPVEGGLFGARLHLVERDVLVEEVAERLHPGPTKRC